MHLVLRSLHTAAMLTWRTPYTSTPCHLAGRVRQMEAANIAKMNLIRGTNMALQFAVLPIAAFITFSVVRQGIVMSRDGYHCWVAGQLGSCQCSVF